MIVPFLEEHWIGAVIEEATFEGQSPVTVAASLIDLASRGMAETSLGPNGEILGFMGTVPITSPAGSCEVFALPTIERGKHPHIFARDVKTDLQRKRLRFWKIYTLGADTPFFRRWFSWLGFSYLVQATSRPAFQGRTLHLWGLHGRSA